MVHSFIITKFTLDTDSTVLYYTLNKVTPKKLDEETHCRQKLKQGGKFVYQSTRIYLPHSTCQSMLNDGLRS